MLMIDRKTLIFAMAGVGSSRGRRRCCGPTMQGQGGLILLESLRDEAWKLELSSNTKQQVDRIAPCHTSTMRVILQCLA